MPKPDLAPEPPDVATTFLLAEHSRLCELYLSTRETAERRVTLFLTLTTTIVGVSVALYQLRLPLTQMLETGIVSALGIFFLGITTYHRLLERGMQSTEYLRAINRIHHYFIERAPETEPYLFWAAYDNIPHYDPRGVGGAETREVILLIDCVFFGLAVGGVIVLIDLNLIVPAGIASWIAFSFCFLAHQRYERFMLDREEKRKSALVRYPLPPDRHPITGQQLTTND